MHRFLLPLVLVLSGFAATGVQAQETVPQESPASDSGAPSITREGLEERVGEIDILDVVPTELHQKTPIYLGSPSCMDLVDRFVGGGETSSAKVAEAV